MNLFAKLATFPKQIIRSFQKALRPYVLKLLNEPVVINNHPEEPIFIQNDSGSRKVIIKVSEELRSFVRANSLLSLKLYDQFKLSSENLFFSPYSIIVSLAMLYGGANGETKEQIAKFLNASLAEQLFHDTIAHLGDILTQLATIDFQLNSANAFWSQKDHLFLKSYLSLLENKYGAEIRSINFAQADQACQQINQWTAEKTNNRIRDVINPSQLDSQIRLLLTSAIYFKANWSSTFEESKTKNLPFWLTSKKSINVPTMHQVAYHGYMETADLQILSLPYTRYHSLSMIILLPKQRDGLAYLESNLSAENIDVWVDQLQSKEVKVYLPKFKLSSNFDLRDTLATRGISHAFDINHANFSAMDGNEHFLYINQIIHQTFVNVDEKGTEAAAVTMSTASMSFSMEPPPTFRADRPFIFFIQENTSRIILFMGRVVNPTVT